MIIGYARVSTQDQNLNSQVDALEASGCEKVFKEVASGVKKEKVELSEALKVLRSGDTLVVYRLDRLGRNLKSLIEFVNDLKEKGVFFKSLSDSIDTSNPMGEFFFNITASFAQLERDLIRERTAAGLSAARARGRTGGRPRAIDNDTFDMALKMKNSEDFSDGEICKRLKINKRSFYRYMTSHKQELEGQSCKD